ncbi:MAG: hypothetical protein Ct9H90mP30_4900 [Actinomycetota bacterium]|nr:MAG: hypothetical protein Ct9H90mP30_4900 [Actinomycetota bacterium]
MPTFAPSHQILKSTKVLLVTVTILLGVLFLFSSSAVSEDNNEKLLFGTHTDIICPAHYQSAPSSEAGTVCQKKNICL